MANVASLLVAAFNLGKQDNSYLRAARLYLHPAHLMSNTELMILLCELMLIFLCFLLLLKTPVPSLPSRLEIEESLSLLFVFFPEPINCFNYQSCLSSVSSIH